MFIKMFCVGHLLLLFLFCFSCFVEFNLINMFHRFTSSIDGSKHLKSVNHRAAQEVSRHLHAQIQISAFVYFLFISILF